MFLYSSGLFPPPKATLSCTVFKTHREIVRQIARPNAHTYRTPRAAQLSLLVRRLIIAPEGCQVSDLQGSLSEAETN